MHLANYKLVRNVSKYLRIPVATVMDLQGPKIRVDDINQPIEIKAGEAVEIGIKQRGDAQKFIPFSYREVIDSVGKNERILIDDGKIVLKVLSKSSEAFLAKVIVGGIVKSHKGLNLPETSLNIPALTKKDKRTDKTSCSA